METNKSWFERQEEIAKKKIQADFDLFKKNDEEMWERYLDRLRTGGPVNCGEGILSQIQPAGENFSATKFPTIEEFAEMLTMISAKRDGNQRPDSVTSISETHYEIWVNGRMLIAPKEAWHNEMQKYFK